MPRLGTQLELPRCPHCNVDRPNLANVHAVQTRAYDGTNARFWRIYQCSRCGGLVTAAARKDGLEIVEAYPTPVSVEATVPKRAREYLEQGLSSLHTPAGAVMLAASAVDAMLKEKGYKDGTLYKRIDKAAKDGIITGDMASWAHEVRLDANDQRHADEDAALPTTEDAKRALDFVSALGQLMFVLPARVQRGIRVAKGEGEPPASPA